MSAHLRRRMSPSTLVRSLRDACSARTSQLEPRGPMYMLHRYVTSSCRPDWCDRAQSGRSRVRGGRMVHARRRVLQSTSTTFPTKTSFNQAETSAVANLRIWTCTPRSTSSTVLRSFKLPLLREGQGGLGLRAALTDRYGRFLSSEMLSAAINTQLLTQQH